MLGRHRKVLGDRAAGMVFDWRRGHGSAQRLLIAGLVSFSFWGALLTSVKIGDPEQAVSYDNEIDLTIVDLDASENRWLTELIDRETLFHRRWDVSDNTVVDQALVAALKKNPPRVYEATLREIALPMPEPNLANLPDLSPGLIPEPDPVDLVVFASPPVNWWVEVTPIDGPAGLVEFAFPWPDQQQMSEGEIWIVILGVDWRGQVLFVEPTSKDDDPRTSVILKKYQALDFEALPEAGPLRLWKLEARVVNRPLPE